MSPTVVEKVPAPLLDQIHELRTRLSTSIPRKRLDDNLLVATWNIRAFGDLTDKWISGDGDSPARDLFALMCITEIVSRFDVIAIQEVKGNIKALRHMMKLLGPDWGLIMTDVTIGSAGNDERMAFVFDTRRVKTSGLAGEVVVPPEWLEVEDMGPEVLDRQFARTPYAVSFISADQTFILVTLHVVYGTKASDRLGELGGLARWMADWARREASWGHNLIALGDFNIDRKDDPAYQAFTSTGLRPPPQLDGVPRTIFATGKEAFYDQIAWFNEPGDVPVLSLDYTGNGGSFSFEGAVMPTLTDIELSWRMSDHLPLWVEFLVNRD